MTSALGNVAGFAARAGGTVVRQIRSALDQSGAGTSGAAEAPASRWLVVTVARGPGDVDAGRLPAPLAQYGDRIEVRVRPAADAKGTELAARLRTESTTSHGRREDPVGELRSALRRAKQLIEVGEVLAVDPAPHGKRTATPGGLALEAVTRRADEEGVR